MSTSSESRLVGPLAELLVRFAANVQPGQILALSTEPGKEELARAVAEVAYRCGARFVDLSVADPYLKRARALYADPDTLEYVPPWFREKLLALGELRCARLSLSGPAEPYLMEGVDLQRLSKTTIYLPESGQVLNARTTNWAIGPCPTPGWAGLVHPDLEPDEALERLWQELGHVCRLDEPDPVAAWNTRLDLLDSVTRKLEALELDALRFNGPGTDLEVGLLPATRWQAARFSTVDGIVHVPNIPTEEVFTTPDPERTHGTVRSTKPLFNSGTVIKGLRVRFEAGRAVEIDADQGADVLRALTGRDAGAVRLGEVALVDREGRIGPLDTIFYDTLLDENAASHIALGQGFEFLFDDNPDAKARINRSAIHIDFMIGSNELAVTGVRGDGTEVPLLRDGRWQI